MSLAIGVVSSSSKSMGFEDNKDNEAAERSSEETKRTEEKVQDNEEEEEEEAVDEQPAVINRTMSESSIYATEDDEDDEGKKIELGPQFTLKEQMEKDKVCLYSSSLFVLFEVLIFSLYYLLYCLFMVII